MKIGVNSVLFGAFDTETAFKWVKTCGYDAIEISAIHGMSEHLVLQDKSWKKYTNAIKKLIKQYELPVQAIEQPSQDPKIMERHTRQPQTSDARSSTAGPGGKKDDEASFIQQSVDNLRKLADMAAKYGVTLCCKAHTSEPQSGIPNDPQAPRSHRPSELRA